MKKREGERERDEDKRRKGLGGRVVAARGCEGKGEGAGTSTGTATVIATTSVPVLPSKEGGYTAKMA